MDAAPVPALRLFGRLGAEASGRLWPWRLPDIGRDRLGQQVRARLRGLAVLREGSGEAPSPAWGPRQAYKMSKFAGATWSRDHRPPAELSGRGPR